MNELFKTLGLSETLFNHIIQLFSQETAVQWLKIYGSRAMGNDKETSDIDLAFSAPGDDLLAARLRAKLDDLPTALSFDVTHYESIQNNALKGHVDSFGLLLFSKTS